MEDILDLTSFGNESKLTIKFISPENTENMLPSEIVAELDRYVVGQEQAKKILAITVANHAVLSKYNLNNPNEAPIKRSNLLLVGPSGSGKTYLVETLGRLLNKPLLTVDITHFTQAGYKGKDVGSIIQELFNVVKKPEEAANAIIFIDEIDKIGTFDADGEGVSTTGVQRELLRLIDGGKQFFEAKGSYKDSIEFDTTNILWVFGGSFNAYLKSKQSSSTSSMGFINTKKPVDHSTMEHEDLIDAGLSRELVGRIGSVVLLNELNRDDYLKILTEPVNSVCKQMEVLGNLRNIDLKLTTKELDQIVDEALELGMGARGLRVLVDKLVIDKMYV